MEREGIKIYTEIPDAIKLANEEVAKPIVPKVGQDGKFSLNFAEKRIVTLEDINQALLNEYEKDSNRRAL